MEDRKRIEMEFHDRLRKVMDDEHVMDTRWSYDMEDTISSNKMWSNMKYYSVERKSRDMVIRWFKDNCFQKKVLDLCCGNGEDGRVIAKFGAKEVQGLDISKVSIDNCKRLSENEGLNIQYHVGDAENTDFSDNTFDIITEYGALHHVDLEKTFADMSRILKPNGKMVCNEALGHNPIIHLYRKLTPSLRTKWEYMHILKKKDLALSKKYFNKIDTHFFHLATLCGVPFRKKASFELLLKKLENIDSVVLRLPGIKWWAWQTVFILSEPIKST